MSLYPSFFHPTFSQAPVIVCGPSGKTPPPFLSPHHSRPSAKPRTTTATPSDSDPAALHDHQVPASRPPSRHPRPSAHLPPLPPGTTASRASHHRTPKLSSPPPPQNYSYTLALSPPSNNSHSTHRRDMPALNPRTRPSQSSRTNPTANPSQHSHVSSSTPSIARTFRLRSAHLSSPIFSTDGPSPSTRFQPKSARPNIRINPGPALLSTHPSQLPTCVVPEVCAEFVLDTAKGFLETKDCHLDQRAVRVPLPYAVCLRMSSSPQATSRPVLASLDLDPDSMSSMLVHMIVPAVKFEPSEENSDEYQEAVLTFWAAPGDNFGRCQANFVLTVTADDSFTWETTVQITADPVDPVVTVERPLERTRSNRNDTHVTFEGEESGEEAITVWNDTEGNAPLFMNVYVSDSARGIFNIATSDGDESEVIPMTLPSASSFSFVVRYDLRNATVKQSSYYGCVLIQLGHMGPKTESNSPGAGDQDLNWAYDHVLQLRVNAENVSCIQDLPADELHSPSEEGGGFEEILAAEEALMAKEEEILANEEMLLASAEEGEVTGISPLDFEIEPEEGEFGTWFEDGLVYDGFLSILSPVKWVPNLSEEVSTEDSAQEPDFHQEECGKENDFSSTQGTSLPNAAEGVLQKEAKLDDDIGEAALERKSRSSISLTTCKTKESPANSRVSTDHPPLQVVTPSNGVNERYGITPSAAGGVEEAPERAQHDKVDDDERDIKTPFGKLIGYGTSPTAKANPEISKTLELTADNGLSTEEHVVPVLFEPAKRESGNKDSGDTKASVPQVSDSCSTCDPVHSPSVSANERGPNIDDKKLTANKISKSKNVSPSSRDAQPGGAPKGKVRTSEKENGVTNNPDHSIVNASHKVMLETREENHDEDGEKGYPDPTFCVANIVKSPLPSPQSADTAQSQSGATHTRKKAIAVQQEGADRRVSFMVPATSKLVNAMPYGRQGHRQSLTVGKARGSVSSVQTSLSSVRDFGVIEKTAETLTLRSALFKDYRPRLRMPRKVKKNSLILRANRGSVILPFANGSACDIEVHASFDSVRSTANVVLNPSCMVVRAHQRSEIVVLRNSPWGERLGIIILCKSIKNEKSQTVYRVPLIVEQARKPPGLSAFTVNRPSLSFYSPVGRTPYSQVRVFNNTNKDASYRIWVGQEGDGPKASKSPFQLKTPPNGIIPAKEFVEVDVQFNAGDRIDHFYEDLTISVNGRKERMPMFGYGGASDIKLEFSKRNILRARNMGDRAGFIVVTGPLGILSECDSNRLVMLPGDDLRLKMPHGTGSVIFTGDEIARQRFCKALSYGREGPAKNDILVELFNKEFRDSEVVMNKEDLEFSGDNRLSLHYAGRLLGACTTKYEFDASGESVKLTPGVRGGIAGTWSAFYEGNRLVRILNNDANQEMKFAAEGTDPGRGFVAALGDAILVAFREQVVIHCRGERVKLNIESKLRR